LIISRTPNRATLFGSSTDYPNWYKLHGGISVNFAIDKYSWFCCKKLPSFFDYTSKISYSEVDCVNHISEIKHNIVREALVYKDVHNVDLVHQSDLFSKCGLGSSSSFAVGLMHTLSSMRGEFLSKWKLAKETINLEQNILKENVGVQDTLAASFGGLNQIDYFVNENITVTPIFLNKDFMQYFEDSILLLFTSQRIAHNVCGKYIPTLLEKEKQQLRMIEIARDGVEELRSGNIENVGSLLNLTWEEKRQISPEISTDVIDGIYELSKKHAWGFKLMGAGGGGTILILAPKHKHKKIIEESKLLNIPVRIDYNGSKILYFKQDEF